MTNSRKPGFVLPVAVILAVLLGLYVGAYYAMVKPEFVLVRLASPGPETPYIVDWYRGPVPLLGAIRNLFAPMNWLDRIRPNVWNPDSRSLL